MAQHCHLVEIAAGVVEPAVAEMRSFVAELKGRLSGIPHEVALAETAPIAAQWAHHSDGHFFRGVPADHAAHTVSMVGSFWSDTMGSAEQLAQQVFHAALVQTGAAPRATEFQLVVVAAGDRIESAIPLEIQAGAVVTPAHFHAIMQCETEWSDEGFIPDSSLRSFGVFARECIGGSHYGLPTQRGALHVWDRIRDAGRPTTGETVRYGDVTPVVEQLDELRETLGRAPTRAEVNMNAWEQIATGADPTRVASMLDVERAGMATVRSLGVLAKAFGMPAVEVPSDTHLIR